MRESKTSYEITEEEFVLWTRAPRTVEFMRRNPGVAERASEWVDRLVEGLEMCARAGEAKESTGEILAYMRGMEERYRTQMTRAARETAEAVGSRVEALMTAVEMTVRGSLERLDAEAFGRAASERIRCWMEERLRSGQEMTAESVRALTERLTEEMRRTQEPSRERHEHAMSVLNALPTQMTAAMTAMMGTREEIEARAAMMGKLCELRAELERTTARREEKAEQQGAEMAKELERVRAEVERMWTEERERGSEQRGALQQQMSQVPMVVKGVLSDMAKEIESQWTQTRMTTGATLQQMAKVETDVAGVTTALAVQKRMVEDMSQKLESLTQQMTRTSTSLRAKGRQGENGLHDMLYDELCRRGEGYSVQMVNGHAHGCDINISRIGHADVRVESKAHGEGTGEKVRTSEVEKFKRDLMGLNAHGIFVSLHSGIVGKGEIEFEQLSNGKFAVYLSNNRYDVGIMHDMVKTMHMLDRLFSEAKGEGEVGGESASVRVPRETMRRVQDYMKDFARRVSETKTHLKDSMSLLSGLAFDQLESMLLGGGGGMKDGMKDGTATAAKAKKGAGGGASKEVVGGKEESESASPLTIKCKWCDKRMGAKMRGPMTMHENTCKGRRDKARETEVGASACDEDGH